MKKDNKKNSAEEKKMDLLNKAIFRMAEKEENPEEKDRLLKLSKQK